MSICYDKSMVEEILNIVEDECLINNELIKRRFLLEIKLKNKKSKKSVCVIMMNPSEANKCISDRTINKVVKYIYNNCITKDYGRLILLNLFVAYETFPKNVNELIKKTDFDYVCGNKMCKMLNNDELIKKECTDSSLIILAWGKGKIIKYRDRADFVINLLHSEKLYCVKDLTKSGYPRHPRNWSYDWKLVKYK